MYWPQHNMSLAIVEAAAAVTACRSHIAICSIHMHENGNVKPNDAQPGYVLSPRSSSADLAMMPLFLCMHRTDQMSQTFRQGFVLVSQSLLTYTAHDQLLEASFRHVPPSLG